MVGCLLFLEKIKILHKIRNTGISAQTHSGHGLQMSHSLCQATPERETLEALGLSRGEKELTSFMEMLI